MRITVVGGSEGTGKALVDLAVEAGDEVTVVSRSGAERDGVRTVVGDAADPVVAAQAVAGADAVVVTVGGAKGVPHQRSAVTRAVVAAMQDQGVRRLVVQSSLGAGDSASQLPAVLRPITMAALAKPLADHDEQEAVVTGSGLDWTIVRPAGLTNKPGTGTWRAMRVSEPGTLGGSVPRRDVAAFILSAIDDPSTFGEAIGVSAR